MKKHNENIPVEYTDDGYIKHVYKEGARYHVISYGLMYRTGGFRRCSEPKCEINRTTQYSKNSPNASWSLPK